MEKRLKNYKLNYVFEPPNKNKDIKFKRQFLNEDIIKNPPQKVDLRDSLEVYDQEDIGACTTNAIATALILIQKNNKNITNPSRLFIYYNARLIDSIESGINMLSEDTGLSLRSVLKSIAQYKFCDEKIWPYDINEFSTKPTDISYMSAQNSVSKFLYLSVDFNDIRISLSVGFPVLFGVRLFSSFENFKDGFVVPDPDEYNDNKEGAHAMLIVGFIDESKLFIIANSWSKNWGDNGFCYMTYNHVKNHGLDFWMIKKLIINDTKNIHNDYASLRRNSL